jgi:hypothetical protein
LENLEGGISWAADSLRGHGSRQRKLLVTKRGNGFHFQWCALMFAPVLDVEQFVALM